MIKKIITIPDKRLREKSLKINPLEIKQGKFARLVFDLIETMKKSSGVGIAAPQIGKNFRIVIINAKDGPLALINPIITNRSWRKNIEEEGCLSVPGVIGLVRRNNSFRVKALSARGEKLDFRARGFFARVIDHEVDHLNGVLFIDKAEKLKGQS